jgi:hypothetical protein
LKSVREIGWEAKQQKYELEAESRDWILGEYER